MENGPRPFPANLTSLGESVAASEWEHRVRTVALSVVLVLAGCAVMPTQPNLVASDVISVQVGGGPFCFPCTYDEMTIRGDGRIMRKRWSWHGVTRERRLLAIERKRIPLEQVARIRSALVTYRLKGLRVVEGEGACVPDSGDGSITWKDQTEDQLTFDLGCSGVALSELRATLLSVSGLAGVEPIRW